MERRTKTIILSTNSVETNKSMNACIMCTLYTKVLTLRCFEWNISGKRSISLRVACVNLKVISCIWFKAFHNKLSLVTDNCFD